MADILRQCRQAGLSELASQFATFISRLDSTKDPLVALTAGALSEWVAQGHVCLDVTGDNGWPFIDEQLTTQGLGWQQRLQMSTVVGQPGDYTPLILTADGRLYLYRYWLDEQRVAQAIHARAQPLSNLDQQQLQQDLAGWDNPVEGIDWQKVAVVMALTQRFCVISGGPGTGKTTIVLKILHSLLRQQADMRITLAAPTGKAAARLQQSLDGKFAAAVEAKTLHRLLGISVTNERGRYHRGRPLPVDVLIVDEASMIDISLMARLFDALANETRLILLGDSQQLASVESGAVLANLADQTAGYSSQFINQVKAVVDIDLSSLQAAKVSVMTDSLVSLQHSYRFDQHSVIGQLAAAVNAAQATTFLAIIGAQQPPIQFTLAAAAQLQQYLLGYQPYIEAVSQYQPAEVCLQAFDQFQVLAALKQGPYSVDSVNRLLGRHLLSQGWQTQQAFYHGRPIMVTVNDYRQRLFNGDTGLILQHPQGELKACFRDVRGLRWIALSSLPAHETVFAMTVHKSQGSEFDGVAVLLPDEDNQLLNRELLYTAITRGKTTLNLMATEQVLIDTINSSHQRQSGLSKQLALLS